jgi:hypothetical protein
MPAPALSLSHRVLCKGEQVACVFSATLADRVAPSFGAFAVGLMHEIVMTCRGDIVRFRTILRALSNAWPLSVREEQV